METKSVLVAVTGGIGSGKSSLAAIIREMGYPVISSDENAKEITDSDKSARDKIRKLFGAGAFNENGKLDGKFIASKVFGAGKESQKALDELNRIIHPLVIERMINEVEALIKKGEKLIFVESALTFEAGLEEGFDYIITVSAPESLRIERVKKRSGMGEKEIRQRMAAQISPEEKSKAADFDIDNSGSLDNLKNSAEFIISVLEQAAGS